MLISVIIPVYNVEKYISICLDSVLAQTYRDFEVILVDDGSTDQSGKICDYYAEKDNRLHVIHQQNGGLSSARNKGVENSKGDYVFFLDSDDAINPRTLEILASVARKYQAPLVQIDIEEVSDDFADYEKAVTDDYAVFEFNGIDAFYNLDKDNKELAKDIRLISIVVWTKLYRRDLVEKIKFPEDIRLHEDQMVAHRFVVEAGRLVFCRVPLYYYRKRPASLITEGWTPKRLTILDCYKDRVEWSREVTGEKEQVDALSYYIYIRYLTCMFKNYWMASKKLTGQEKKDCQATILKRYRDEMSRYHGKYKCKDWILFQLFRHFPNLFTTTYGKIKNRK